MRWCICVISGTCTTFNAPTFSSLTNALKTHYLRNIIQTLRLCSDFHLCHLISFIRDIRGESKQTHPTCKDRRRTGIHPELERPRGPNHHNGMCVVVFPAWLSVLKGILLIVVLLLFAAKFLFSQANQKGPFPGGKIQSVQMDTCHKRCNGG